MKSAVNILPTLSSRRSKRSLHASRLLLRKQLWIWPLLAAVVVIALALWVRSQVEETIRTNVRDDLQAVLSANVAALEMWIEMQQEIARAISQDPELEQYAAQLVAADPADPVRGLLGSPLQQELREALEPVLKEHHYESFVLTDRQARILASPDRELIGQQMPESLRPLFSAVLNGKAVVTRPFPSMIALRAQDGAVRAGVPTMFVAAPIRNEQGESIAVLALRIDPDIDFTRILATARIGASGETYAFDAAGVMLTQSRFDEQLKQIGLIPDRPDAHSTLYLRLLDPGVDMTTGRRPTKRRDDLPLTHVVEQAAAGRDGFDINGYRDYRGVTVVGAWKWLPERGFGVVTEQDRSEAFRPLHVLRKAFLTLIGLLALAAAAIFVFTIIVARLQRKAQRAALDAKQLGQYTLDEKIGSGGMGVVYKGHHAMLRRPTAIKLLDVEKVTDDAIARFEREVQLTCKLTHPNTIAIYDYGRTPEGVFYYAMEYLDGLSLEALVTRSGAQPEGRVIKILAQVCGSLAEAHSLGLVHRDIKPANILLNQRGGEFDVVKVLDFGLVKAIGEYKLASLTAADRMAGTPLYMSPEAIQTPTSVGPASDIYAVGAVGYYLLTGTPVFTGDSIITVCQHQVNDPPEPPSQRLGRPVSADFEALLLQCLSKNPADRPATARQLAEELLACHAASTWTTEQAEQWWRCHTPISAGSTTLEAVQPTHSSDVAAVTTTQFQHKPS